jgi:hypothetical protein
MPRPSSALTAYLLRRHYFDTEGAPCTLDQGHNGALALLYVFCYQASGQIRD